MRCAFGEPSRGASAAAAVFGRAAGARLLLRLFSLFAFLSFFAFFSDDAMTKRTNATRRHRAPSGSEEEGASRGDESEPNETQAPSAQGGKI